MRHLELCKRNYENFKGSQNYVAFNFGLLQIVAVNLLLLQQTIKRHGHIDSSEDSAIIEDPHGLCIAKLVNKKH